MNQLYFSSNIQTGYIKSILKNVALPIYDVVNPGDYIIKNFYYIYKCRLIKCLSSGYLGTYLGNTKTPIASYESIRHIELGEYIPNVTEKFNSTYNYYDSKTHEVLGRYLRTIKNLWEIDLLPFYNCFTGDTIDTVYINEGKVYEKKISQYKILKVPIKFNTNYTIAIDCPLKVQIAPVMLSLNQLLTINGVDLTELVSLQNNVFTLPSTSFKQPLLYRVNNTNFTQVKNSSKQIDEYLQMYEQDLFMLIQLPFNINSSIVILEGDYTNSKLKNVIDISSVSDMSGYELCDLLRNDLSLLQLSDQQSYPYADRLIEYLLFNVITDRDEFHHDIEDIQDKYSQYYKSSKLYGIWDSILRYKIYMDFNKNKKISNIDTNGFVDKDTESFILRKKQLGE